jgi:hypothetical protein
LPNLESSAERHAHQAKGEKYSDMSLLYRWAPPWERGVSPANIYECQCFFDNPALLHWFLFFAAIVKPSRRDAGAPRGGAHRYSKENASI